MHVTRQISIRQRFLVLLTLSLAMAVPACTDDRNAVTPGELFHCGADNDCLSGWTCQCGYCQQPGIPQFACGVSAGDTTEDANIGADTSVDDAAADAMGSDALGTDASTDAATDSSNDTGGPPVGTPIGVCNQSVSSDVVFTSCNLATWTGCDAGFGCYYGPAIKQTLCKKHSTLGEGAVCDPCNLTDCGLASDNHVLICDLPTKACHRTCDATVPLKPNQCPTGEQCYQLTDDKNVPYPSTGGICAP